MANQQISYVNLFLLLFSAFAYNVHAFQFTVGGKDGWVLNPSENYNHWAERMRFQVNDTLLFKYKKGSDSVLVVNKDEYERCNTRNPISKLQDGNSIIKFNMSGPVFFISGHKSNCINGQKLVIVVLAVRNHHSPPPPKAPSPAAGPAPNGSSPGSSPLSPSPSATSDGPSPNSAPGGVVNTGGPPPPRRSFATPPCIPSVVLVSTVSLVLSVCLGGFIIIF